ncbi:MAG: hypothetical protein CRN43_21075 [Candidatus Nephrothrix sp. EaCA]|nr:MAG: hypothetical protein CRN43_21075 [Candidatus Nephrothrix sp. EaCA]
MPLRLYQAAFLIALFAPCLCANGQDIIYSQSVVRDDPYFCFALRRGKIALTQDSLSFRVPNKRGQRYSFSEPLKNISEVRKAFLPNRIIIRTWSGKRYRLYAYKRNDLIGYTRDVMAKKPSLKAN